MRKKWRHGCTRVKVFTERVIYCEAWPMMSPELDADLHEYGCMEVFGAAEQLWAMQVGLAEKVPDFAPQPHAATKDKGEIG